MPDISIVIPTIRTPQLPALWDSLLKACAQHAFQLVLVGPFVPPDQILQDSRVLFLRDYSRPSVCAQVAIAAAAGPLIYYTVDDCDFIPGSIDQGIATYRAMCDHKDVVNMRYREGGSGMDLGYWRTGYHDDLRRLALDPETGISLQFLMCREYFIEIGGFDCAFEYTNCAGHDLMFRIQKDGGYLFQSPTDVCIADWMIGTTGDHGPIHYCETEHDMPLLRSWYATANARTRIPFENWQEHTGVWARRFGTGLLPERYVDMYPDATASKFRR